MPGPGCQDSRALLLRSAARMLTPAQIAAFKRDGAVRPPGLARNCNTNSNTISK